MAAPLKIDPRLLDYCETERQKDLICAIIECGGVRAAAARLGIGERAAFECLARIRKRAGLNGFCPEAVVDRPTIPGFTLNRVSTLTRNEAGEPQWQIQQPDKAAQAQALKDFVAGLCAEIIPAAPTQIVPAQRDSDLLAAIVLGDPHFGLYTYSPETRNRDWDTDIAGRDTRAAMDDLITRSPNAETGVLINVGDAMHMDSSHNTTFAGTPVDADTRYHRVMRSLAMTLRYGVDQMLKKYGKVVVVCARGNHDPDSAIAIQLMLEFYYESEPRVTVLRTQGFFHHIEFGKWLIGIHHGDKVKAQKLVNILARDLPESWGRTENRIWLVGHEHHQEVIELDGCKVRKFGTLAPSDGWHASKGYAGESTMELLVFRRGGGMHSSLIYNIPKHKNVPDVVI
jgi:hypothetical protein